MRKVCGLNLQQLRAGRKPSLNKPDMLTDKIVSTDINVSPEVLINAQDEEVPVEASVPEMQVFEYNNTKRSRFMDRFYIRTIRACNHGITWSFRLNEALLDPLHVHGLARVHITSPSSI